MPRHNIPDVFGKMGSIQRHSIAAYIRFLHKDNKDVELRIQLEHQMPRVKVGVGVGVGDWPFHLFLAQ